MLTNKEIASQVLEGIVAGSSSYYEVDSQMPPSTGVRKTRISYGNPFREFVSGLNGRKHAFLDEFSKFHRCATAYGYQGHSEGKKNGIVDVNESNGPLLADYKRLLTPQVIQDNGLHPKTLKPVKVVAHVPNGNRLVGVLDLTPTQSPSGSYHAVVILGVSNYKGKVKL